MSSTFQHAEAALMDAESKRRPTGLLTLAVLVLFASAGCSGGGGDLDSFIQKVKAAPGGRVEPLPVIQPYETFTYADQNMRSPFMPGGSGASTVRPDANRQREYLEQFSLDTLKMVGTLAIAGNHYGLVLAKDGRVHRVTVGNHMGENDGTVTDIEPSKIALTEIVPDGLGGYVERPAALALNQ